MRAITPKWEKITAYRFGFWDSSIKRGNNGPDVAYNTMTTKTLFLFFTDQPVNRKCGTSFIEH